MQKNTFIFRLLPIVFAITTAPFLSFAFVVPVIANYQQRVIETRNCATFTSPEKGKPIDIKFIDPETGAVHVNQPVNGRENVVILNYKNSANDGLCSLPARLLFERIREIEQKQIADTCVDFKEIVAGKRSNVGRDGAVGNLNAARSFIANHCK